MRPELSLQLPNYTAECASCDGQVESSFIFRKGVAAEAMEATAVVSMHKAR